MLYDQNMQEETKREFLKIIDEESDRLTNLINDILEIGRIEAGTIEITLKAVNMTSVISRAVADLEYLAGKKTLRIKTELAENLPELLGDENKIHSMITNLVNNAIKFTPEKGQITVSAQVSNNEFVIKVADSGMGIPKEDLPKIFGRFYRVHRPGKQIQGSGLGLAIVKEIVIRHDGRIEVESETDKGSTFTVYLPCAPQTVTAKGDKSPANG
jgi:two-component system phosphate regulon sensor histidine kinase PhoR